MKFAYLRSRDPIAGKLCIEHQVPYLPKYFYSSPFVNIPVYWLLKVDTFLFASHFH